MPEQTKLVGQIAILFLVAAILLLLMDRQMLIGPKELDQWPFALLSFVVMAGLFIVVASLVHARVSGLCRRPWQPGTSVDREQPRTCRNEG